MYTIRAELERGGFSIKRAANASDALDRVASMEGLKIEISGPEGEPLTKNDLLVRLSREARELANRELANKNLADRSVAKLSA
jgi:hypothetical protein